MTALLNRASLIVLAAVALSACTTARSQYAPYEGYKAPPSPTPAPVNAAAETAPPVSDQSPPSAATPIAPVASQALPPVNRRPDAASSGPIDTAPTPAPTPAPAPPTTSYAPPPAPTATYTPPPPSSLLSEGPSARAARAARHAPPPEPDYVLSVKGKVVAAKRATRTITVDKGDTINDLSDRYLISKAELIKANKLRKPYEIDSGQSLKIPTPKAYEVESGDTLYSIGKRFNVAADVLAELNNLDPKGHLRSGEEVVLPVGIKDSGPIKHAAGPGSENREAGYPTAGEPHQTYTPPAYTPPSYTPSPGPLPPVRGETPVTPPPADTTPPPTDADVAAAGRGRFMWPLHGDTLSGFGPKPGGQRNDGLDIAAPLGTSVKAAAAGYVVYAGDEVPGFGNLVLIKHEGGWVTAYAHLSKTLVKIKDHLEQGDQVGEVGQTGGVDLPQLHFEIRYAQSTHDRAKPVDPTLVLPAQ